MAVVEATGATTAAKTTRTSAVVTVKATVMGTSAAAASWTTWLKFVMVGRLRDNGNQ